MDRSLLVFSKVTKSKWPPGCHLVFFGFWALTLVWLLNIKSKLQCHITCVYGKEPIDFQRCHFQNGHLVAILDFFISGLCRWHGFQGVSSISNFTRTKSFVCKHDCNLTNYYCTLDNSQLVSQDNPHAAQAMTLQMKMFTSFCWLLPRCINLWSLPVGCLALHKMQYGSCLTVWNLRLICRV